MAHQTAFLINLLVLFNVSFVYLGSEWRLAWTIGVASTIAQDLIERVSLANAWAVIAHQTWSSPQTESRLGKHCGQWSRTARRKLGLTKGKLTSTKFTCRYKHCAWGNAKSHRSWPGWQEVPLQASPAAPSGGAAGNKLGSPIPSVLRISSPSSPIKLTACLVTKAGVTIPDPLSRARVTVFLKSMVLRSASSSSIQMNS
mmetsp:Transcript_28066/g.75993  ORF Transcript_28066/g.75993 Transcript_28066/m.75993 type:complete len:200 (+) Transcript_28066:170-769(+)